MFSQDDLQSERRKQINTLKIFNDNVSETTNNIEYRVDFLAGNKNFSLHVHLSHYFPLDKPILKISPSISHPWVDSTGTEIISAPGLLNFSRHSDLGRVVQAVIRELQLRPPLITERSLPNLPPHNSNNVPLQPLGTSPKSTPQPIFPFNLPDISKLSLEELKLLDENVDCLEAFVKEIEPLKEFDSVIDSLISTNEILASENLEKEALLKENTEELKGKIETLTELQDKFELKNHEYDKLVEKYLPRNIKDQLMKTVKLNESDSDVIVESFLDNKINLETFLSSYLEKRVTTHRLQTKGERLSYQLEALEKASH